MKTHRITTSKTWGPMDIEEDSENPFDWGLEAKWTCEAGGSLWKGSAGNWLPLGSMKASTLVPPHAAVPDNIITAGTL